MRAAASSIASGRPSSLRQISATAATLSSVKAKWPLTAWARSTNSRTDSQSFSAVSGSLSRRVGQQQGRHEQLSLGRQAQRGPAGDHHMEPRTGGQELTDLERGAEHLLEIVDDEQQLPVAQEALQTLERRPAPCHADAKCLRDGGGNEQRVADRRQRHEAHPVFEPIKHGCRRSRARRVLPIPPGPVSVSNRLVATRAWICISSCSRPMKLVSDWCSAADGAIGRAAGWPSTPEQRGSARIVQSQGFNQTLNCLRIRESGARLARGPRCRARSVRLAPPAPPASGQRRLGGAAVTRRKPPAGLSRLLSHAPRPASLLDER